MYHFVWADQREKQGYKSDVFQKREIQLFVPWENKTLIKTATDATPYTDTTKCLSIVQLNLLIFAG